MASFLALCIALAACSDSELRLPMEVSAYREDPIMNLDVPGAMAEDIVTDRSGPSTPFADYVPDLILTRRWTEADESVLVDVVTEATETGASWSSVSCGSQISLHGRKDLPGSVKVDLFYDPDKRELSVHLRAVGGVFDTAEIDDEVDPSEIDEGCDVALIEAAGIQHDRARFEARWALETDPVIDPLDATGRQEPSIHRFNAHPARVGISATYPGTSSVDDLRRFVERSLELGATYREVSCFDDPAKGRISLSGSKQVADVATDFNVSYRSERLLVTLDQPVPPGGWKQHDVVEIDSSCPSWLTAIGEETP